jgi:hypothetical protein
VLSRSRDLVRVATLLGWVSPSVSFPASPRPPYRFCHSDLKTFNLPESVPDWGLTALGMFLIPLQT